MQVIAPDYPGFGQSWPPPKDYTFTFVNLAETIDALTEQAGLKKYVVYMFDFGGPVGMLLGLKHPERIAGMFSQSGNVYDEGLSPAFEGIRAMWANPKDEAIWEKLNHIFSEEGIRGAYTLGVQNPADIAPDAPNLDVYFTSRPGALEIQQKLLIDYETNVKA